MIGIQMQTVATSDDDRMGSYVRRLRHARGLTLIQLAELVGLSQPFLSQLERGQARPSMASLDKIARALGSSQLELVAGAAGLSRPTAESQHSLVRSGDGDSGAYGLGEATLLVNGDRPFYPMRFVGHNADPSGFHDHPEDEFLHVLSGRCHVDLGSNVFKLGSGDSLYYVGGTPHRWYAPDGSRYELFVVKQHLAVHAGFDSDPSMVAELRGAQ